MNRAEPWSGLNNAESASTAPYLPIADYGLIGDCRATALVSRDGSIDWLCFPRFDSPSVFGALLDAESGGRFRIRPTGSFETHRRYLPETNILETTFRTSAGSLALGDLMPVSSEAKKHRQLIPDHQVLREIEGLEGEIEIEVFYDPRSDYGRCRPRFEDRGPLGLWTEVSRAALVLRSELEVKPTATGEVARGVATIHAGERKYLSFTYMEEAPQVVPPLGGVARARVERSARWWRDWASRCTYGGPYRDAVVRSALVADGLRALRCGRCRSDNLITGAARWGPQLGLSLLLVARRVVHSAPCSRSVITKKPKRSCSGCCTPLA